MYLFFRGTSCGSMLDSIIQSVNNITNVTSPPSVEYDILQGSVALLVGFLIFFSLGWRFELTHHIMKRKKIISHLSFDSLLLLIMVFSATISAIFSLVAYLGIYEISTPRFIAVSFFAISLISLSIFVFSILYNPPKRPEGGNPTTWLPIPIVALLH